MSPNQPDQHFIRNSQLLDLSISEVIGARASRVIPWGTNTGSKRACVYADHFPRFAASASGCRVTDVDGHSYIDFVAALAPVVLGYGIERIDAKVREQLSRGVLLSLPTQAEVELSEKLVELIPCAEMVRLVKSGAEAVAATVRIARTVTGRQEIASCGYHGWHDWWAGPAGFDGIPREISALTHTFAFNDLEAAEALFEVRGGAIAGIVVTPAIYGMQPSPQFLKGLRKLCDQFGALLIFDEIITGFRWHIGGAQCLFGVTPDLAAFAKALANGMPLAAVVGKREPMEYLENNWVSSTYASEALSIVAALETLAILEEGWAIPRLYEIALQLKQGLSDIAFRLSTPMSISEALPAITFSFLEPVTQATGWRRAYVEACAYHGVLIRPQGDGFSLCTMASMTNDDIAIALVAMSDAARFMLARGRVDT